MFASSWLRQLQHRWFPRRLNRRAPIRRVSPCLEVLEDRTLLTAWTPIGPAPILNGETAGNLSVSGRVTGVATDPKDANTIYIATAGGGIWKTTNATDTNPTWTPLTDNLTDSNNNPIPEFMGAVAETDATSGTYSGSQIVYAGTGEANDSGDSFYGEGILVSTDGGNTWTLTNPGGAFTRRTISKIVIDPSDTTGATAYAAVADNAANGQTGNTGIWKTTNFGQTWTNMTGAAGLSTTNSWSDVVIDTGNKPSILYAAEANPAGAAGNGVYKSTDGGTTWTLLTAAPSGSQDGRISLAVYHNPNVINELFVSIAYPTTSSNSGQLYEMLRSYSDGSSFDTLTYTPNYMGQNGNGQGFYDSTLAIDPANPNVIYAGGSDNGGTPGNIESFDGGNSWVNINDLGGYGSDYGPHSDDHAVAFDANGNLIDGNDGGVYKLTDPTDQNKESWSSLNSNLQITQFYGVAVDPTNGYVVYGGSQDNGEDKYSGSLGWNEIYGGDGGITRVDPTNDNIVYEEYADVALNISTNAGGSFSPITNGIKYNKSNGEPIVNFMAPYVLDNLGNIYYGTDYLNLSTNHGSSWTQIGTPGTNGFNPSDAPIDAIAVSPSGDVVYVSAGGKLFVTQNAQDQVNPVTWTEIDLPNGVKAGALNSLAAESDGTAYAVVSSFQSGGNHVFQTTNYGQSWTDISGNLPNTPVNCVAVNPIYESVWVGTDVGVYSTSNINGGSTSWSKFGTGLPNAQVEELDLLANQNLLVVGTHGRGAWETTPVDVAPIIDNVTSTTANGTYGPGATVSIQLTFKSVVFVNTSGGTPTLALSSGGTASYSSGSGTKTLTFTYIVAGGDTTNGGKVDYSSTSALSLNGATIQDAGGNNADLNLPYDGTTESLSDNTDIVIDATIPTVTNVTSSTPNGTYGPGAVISIQVTFSEAVTVSGTPTLTLSDGETATYSGGSGTTTLTFTYTVAAGDTTNGGYLNYSGTSALSLNGGTITNAGGVTASLTLPTNSSGYSLLDNKEIIIDAAAPTITNVRANTPPGAYGTGAVIIIQVFFNENVTVTGTPTLALSDGETATYNGVGNGTNILLFTYTVAAGDTTNGANLDYTSTSALSGGTIQNVGGVSANEMLPAPRSTNDQLGNGGILIDATTPTVTGVTTTTAAGTYGTGTDITIQVNFSENVFVTGMPTPTLTLSDGKTASLRGGNGTQTLTFTYIVASGDTTNGANLDYTNTSGLNGTITNAGGVSANLVLPAPDSTNDTFGTKGIVIDATTPTVTSVSTTTPAGTYGPGAVITIQVNFSENVFVTGTPVLRLNDGKTASYLSGSGSRQLIFTYTVGAGATTKGVNIDYTNTSALSGTIHNAGGVSANLTLPAPASTIDTFGTASIIIDATTPTLTSISTTTAAGTYGPGSVVTIEVNFSENVFVTGTPTLMLNDGETASYSSGSGTSTLTFTYTVAANDTTQGTNLDYSSISALSGTIHNAGGVSANLTLPAPRSTSDAFGNQDIIIDATTPTVTSVSTTTEAGTYGPGTVITIQVNFSEAVTVIGTPTLALNDGETASYNSGSGTSTLTFTYTVAANDTTQGTNLDYTSTSAIRGTIQNAGGVSANLILPTPTSTNDTFGTAAIIIDATTPTITNVSSPNASGIYGPGAVITIEVSFSENVFVTGTPALTLNDGETATYSSGSGTSTLAFTYTVAANDTTNDLSLDYSSIGALNGTIENAGGVAANQTLPTPASAKDTFATANIIIDATTPTVTSVSTSTAANTYGPGTVMTIEVSFSETVTVIGTPTLTLNDGETAIYSSGSGSSTLVFTYTVTANDTTNGANLDYSSSTALSGGTIENAGGVAANQTLPAPASAKDSFGTTGIIIDATTPTVTSVSTTNVAGTYGASAVITIDVNFSENVFVTGTPTLSLNDGETATYSSGSGSGTLLFTYSVVIGDTTYGANLDYNSITALSGTIHNAGGVAANETLPTLASANDTFGTTGIIIDAPAATTTTAVSTAAPFSTSSQYVTLTANVSSTIGPVNEGNVTFTLMRGNTVFGTATPSAPVSNGQASVQYLLPANLAPTTYVIDASYSDTGGKFQSGSDASQLPVPLLTVLGVPTTTTASSVTTTFNTTSQNVTLTAQVSSNGTPVNGGTVTFALLQGSTAIGTATTSGDVRNGRASVSYVLPSNQSAGRYRIDAVYNPSFPFAISSDVNQRPLAILTVAPAPTTITANNAMVSSSLGTPTAVTLTAQVDSAAGLVNEGTVTFTILMGSTVIGTATTSATVHNGQATVSYDLPANVPFGYYTIEAVYDPGPDFSGSSDIRHMLYVSPAL